MPAKKQNVLTTLIVPRANQLRKKYPKMTQKQAIAKASAEYRQGKLGRGKNGGFIGPLKGITDKLL